MRAILVVAFAIVLVVGGIGLFQSIAGDEGPEAVDTRVRVPARPREPETSSRRRAAVPETNEERAPRSPAEGTRYGDDLRRENELGIAALDAGLHAEAVERFERCVEGRPDESAFTFNLSEALARLALDEYGDGDRDGAIALLERANELRPDRKDLASLAASWRAEKDEEAELWQYETDHFELAFDGEREDLLYGAQDILDVLEDGYVRFSSSFGFDPVARGRARIRVVVTSRADFARATGLGEWAGGAFDGTIRIPMSDLRAERGRWSRVLVHELVHVFVRESGGRHVPGWLNEGLCQWLEGERATVLAGARRALQGHAPFPLESLTGSLIRWQDASEVRRAYAQAVLFVDVIARTYGERVLYAMVAGCDARRDPADVFRDETLVELSAVASDLERELGH